MDSLFQNNIWLNGNRDAISLDISRNKESIILERTFYKFNEFNIWYESEESVLNKIDIKHVNNEVSFNEFTVLFHKFLRKLKTDIPDAVLDQHLNNFFDKRIYSDNDIEVINELFAKYCYLITENKIVSDPSLNKFETLLKQSTYFTEENYDDFNDKPVVENLECLGYKYELRVYNVGQANCSALIKYKEDQPEDYKVLVVFDFGLQKKWGCNPELNDMINKIDYTTTILISHFDSDHINNIASHLLLKTNRWIFPNYSGKAKRASKLFRILIKVASRKTLSHKIYKFATPYKLNDFIKIFQYTGPYIKDHFQSTLINSQCLVSRISSRNVNILIPADALYNEFDSEILDDKYDYILIPHHCCEYPFHSCDSRAFDIKKIIKNNTIGIVLSGENNYGHPNTIHMSQYGTPVMFNRITKKSDEINLFYRINIF